MFIYPSSTSVAALKSNDRQVSRWKVVRKKMETGDGRKGREDWRQEAGDWKKRKGTEMGVTISKFDELVVWKFLNSPNSSGLLSSHPPVSNIYPRLSAYINAG